MLFRISNKNIIGVSFLNAVILFFGILACGLLSVQFGKELNWDLANYHYYNAFSFLNHRLNKDSWPMEYVHVYFTPTADLLSYFLINHLQPKLSVFCIGAIHGMNVWLLFYIANAVLTSWYEIKLRTIIALLLTFLGLYGPTVWPGIGSFQHDNLVSLFVLGFVALQLKAWRGAEIGGKTFFFTHLLSGILLGMGMGLKLTVGIYVAGAMFAYFFVPVSWRIRVKLNLIFILSVFFGMVLTSGYWMFFLWETYQNPFFPLLNGIFHSPYFLDVNWKDTRFLPQGILQYLFYPFYFSLDGRTGDLPFRDFRYACCYLLFIGLVFKKWFSPPHKLPIFITWFLFFFVFSYVMWQGYFSIMRYISALEMLAPLIIYLLLEHLIQDRLLKSAFAVLIFMFLFGTMQPVAMIRAPWYETDYFNVRLPAFVKEIREAVVMMPIPAYALSTNPRPQAYLIPFFPHDWRFIGISFFDDHLVIRPDFYHLLDNIKDKKIYLLGSQFYQEKLLQLINPLGFKEQGVCGLITSDRQFMTHENTWLCPIGRS